MLCVVIGIVPPLDDDSARLEFLEAVNGMGDGEGGTTKIVWAQGTKEISWVVPDSDADDVPTQLLTAVLSKDNGGSDNNESFEGIGSDHGNNVGTTPEEFATFVQSQANEFLRFRENNSTNNYQCEVWASAPAPLPLVRLNSQINDRNNDAADPIEVARLYAEFRSKGLCLLPGILNCPSNDGSVDFLESIRVMVDDAIRNAETAIATNHPNIVIGEDAFLFREIASRSKQRFDLLIDKDTELYNLLYDTVIYDTCLKLESEISTLLKNLFAENINMATIDVPSISYLTEKPDWEVDLSVVYSKPGANHQGWHADGGHLEGASDAGWDCDSTDNKLTSPYAICLFVPLIDLNPTVGFTQFWPGSHRYKDLVGFGPFAEVAKATWDGIVPAGATICYDYRLLHRGMPNQSSADEAATTVQQHPYRAVLQFLCRKKWYTERNNYGTQSIYEKAVEMATSS